jgi:hypothetical protein
MVLIPSRLGRAACPSEIAVIEPPIETNDLLAPLHLTPQNLTNDGDGTPCRIHRPRPSRKLVPFGSQIWRTHQRPLSSIRSHRDIGLLLDNDGSLSRRGRATAGTKSSLHGGQPANSRRSLRGFFQASVLLLQHSLDFYAAPHCGADCLVASRGYQ